GSSQSTPEIPMSRRGYVRKQRHWSSPVLRPRAYDRPPPRWATLGELATPPEVSMLSVQQLLDRKPKGIHTVKPEEPVITAIRKMAEHHVGALLVMQGDKLVGIVSERDYARKVVLLGRSSTETPVRDIMTAKVITVTGRQDAHDCMRLMTD